MKKYILIFFIITINCINITGQNIWRIDPIPEEGFQIVSGISLDSLKNIIIHDKWDSDPFLYSEAAKYLLIYYRNTESQFLLDNLNTVIDNTRNDLYSLLQWDKYYSDTYIKGILGDPDAINRMNFIAQSCPKSDIKVLAIRKLAEAGYYNYWDYLNNHKDEIDVRVAFLMYGENQRYRSDVLNYLEEQIQDVDPNNWTKIISIADDIGDIDSLREINIVDNLFRSTTGITRKYYFDKLNLIDQSNQPARSIWVIPLEPDVFLRSEYIPIMLEDRTFLEAEGYYSPRWIHFMEEWLSKESSSLIKGHIKMNIVDFKPLKIDSISTAENNIHQTISLIDTVFHYNWLGDLNFSNELKNILNIAKTNLQNGDSLACRVQVKEFQDLVDNVYKDSLNTDPRFVTIEGWKFLYWNAQYILDRLPEPQTNPNLLVNLKNSLGNQIPASNVMYYEGSWKDAVNNGDGTFTVITTKPTVSIRMFYEYANQTVNNVPAQNNTYTFTTVNAAVQLKNSSGNLIDEGTVQYYAGAWRSFGTTVNGVVYKELLPVNYSFRMTYGGGNQDKQQNLSDNQTIVFQTVNAAVQLKNSSGNLIDEGTVQYYAGAWRSFGTTVNGVAYKELLPVNYSFRMTYEYVSNDKQQNLSENPVVDFNTVLCTIKVTNANNQPLEGANTKYYSLAWRDIGLTNSNGEITKELLPKNLSFRATYNNVSRDKQQDISVNNLVEIMLNVP
ncbi:MAG: hypothetical protein BWY38_03091 [Ignavibacteria bacterium ADurb.Bin266]|nr:MAG: hypothetical protein BWY38_03091 [Ignavibacteria bacterium ADurb.Bin266]